MNTKPTAMECRFAFYSKSKSPDDNRDLHVVKEIQHFTDAEGKIIYKPNLRLVYDYKRDFYVTKKGLQNHESKKEWEDISNLNLFKSRQTDLVFNAAKALGKPYFRGSLRDLHSSPYLYGTDISSTSLIKQGYMNRWDITTPYSNAVFDTETDVLHGTNEIMMATFSLKETVYTVVQKRFVQGHSDVINRVLTLADKYIGEIIKKRNIKIELVLVDTEIDVVKKTIAKAHELKPDFLSVWNLAFDMDKIIEACQRAKVDVASILNDPSIPQHFRHFNFKKGAAKKTTASGKVMNYKPSARWHYVDSPASFTWIDAMCAYKQVRAGQPEEKSYSLDYILKKILKIGKLKFKAADEYNGLVWHQFMQLHYPLEYIVYNMFDCISMEMLDEKTLDLQLTLPMLAGCTDLDRFNSQPKKTADKLHTFCLKHNKVIGTTSGEMREEADSDVVSLSNWIKTLSPYRVIYIE